MTKKEAKELRVALDAELAKLQIKGFRFSLGNGTFRENVITFQLKCGRVNEKGEVASRESQDFKEFCFLYGLQESDLNRVFTCNKTQYKIVGINPRSKNNPIVVLRVSDGKGFKFPIETLRPCLDGTYNKRRENEILEELRQIEAKLSPENLSCDGELPVWKVKMIEGQLKNQKQRLIAELGRTPTDQELFGR